jgi:hypothetical protein
MLGEAGVGGVVEEAVLKKLFEWTDFHHAETKIHSYDY